MELDNGRKNLSVAVSGPLIANDLDVVIRAALEDARLTYMDDDKAAPHLSTDRLVRVFEDWSQLLPWVLPLLSQPDATAGCTFGVDRVSPTELGPFMHARGAAD